uniref:Uncharacterized protein n=1 Tax=Chlamydomonas leiostraca TaxID=1034604 RepID=A0A7S0RHX5_9CHLO|mmetsp:Transcript_22968/g.58721  ORF Transcript_22968/g.58721 Transcript_22968/m.58721 type:complete len:214 (+) Transcript_22968:225-866(+)
MVVWGQHLRKQAGAEASSCSSSSNTMAHELEHHVKHKPLKRRGLSRYYSSKSQSFSSLELALTTQYGEHAMGLGKGQPDMACTIPCGSSSGMARMSSCTDWSSAYRHSATSDLSCSTSSAAMMLAEEGPFCVETQSAWMPQSTAVLCDDLCRALREAAITHPRADHHSPSHADSPSRHTSLLTHDLRPGSGGQLHLSPALLAVGKGGGRCMDC